MGVQRDQCHFGRAKWRSLLLVPFWVLQLVLLLGLVGLFSYRLAVSPKSFDGVDEDRSISIFRLVLQVINIAFSIFSALLTAMEIFKYITESLTPYAMLVSHVIKTSLACGLLGMNVAAYTKINHEPYMITGMAVACALLVTTSVPATYCVLVYRRLLKQDYYHHPANVKAYGFTTPNVAIPVVSTISTPTNVANPSTDHTALELGDKMNVYFAGGENNNDNSISPYYDSVAGSKTEVNETSNEENASTTSPVDPRRQSRLSMTSISTLAPKQDRHVSTGSTASLPTTAVTPREKYSHERSTKFEEYVNRRLSMGENDLERAELGWQAASLSRPVSGDFAARKRRSGVYSGLWDPTSPTVNGLRVPRPLKQGGVVAAPMAPSQGRVMSWGSNRVALRAVPEAAEEGGGGRQNHTMGSSTWSDESSGSRSTSGLPQGWKMPVTVDAKRGLVARTAGGKPAGRRFTVAIAEQWPLNAPDEWQSGPCETVPLREGRMSSDGPQDRTARHSRW